MDFQVRFYSETGWQLGVSLITADSEKKATELIEKEVTEEKTIKASPYGDDINLGSVIITSKIASFVVHERK